MTDPAEIMARATCREYMSRPALDGEPYWEGFGESLDEAVEKEWRDADFSPAAALRALDAARYAVVPKVATDTTDLRQCFAAFHHWVVSNNFTDPDHMLVCAEWHNLCSAAGLEFKMAGHDFREKYPPDPPSAALAAAPGGGV